MPRLWYCDHHVLELPAGHKFPTQKYRLLREELSADVRITFEPAPLVTRDSVALVHDVVYVDAILTGEIDPRVMRRIGFPWSPSLVRRTLASVGGTIAAARDALDAGWGGNLAGGTHHAFRSEGAGFCVFNDIAIAISVLRDEGLLERAAVVDLDVHQGDGTATIFADDPQVFTLSIHGRDNFPFRKQTSDMDVALPDNAADEEYLQELHNALPRAFEHQPDLVFYQSGVDALASDRLGRLQVSEAALRERDRVVFDECQRRGVPCAITLGGGYSDPISHTVQAHANTFRMALSIWMV